MLQDLTVTIQDGELTDAWVAEQFAWLDDLAKERRGPARQHAKGAGRSWRRYYKPHRSFGEIGETHKCCRCARDLPWDRFGPLPFIGKGKKRRKYGNRGPLELALDGVCRTCRRQLRGKWVHHPLYSMEMDRFWAKRVSSQKASAAARGLAFLISVEDAFGLFLEQGGKCALSGINMRISDETGSRRNWLAPSIDRIDSGLGYTLDNIQIVCAAINLAKQDLSQSEFLLMCVSVVNYTEQREKELRDFFGSGDE